AGRFDASLKDLFAGYPADWLSFLGLPAAEAEVIDADVSTVSADADRVLRVGADDPWLLHVELQSSPRSDPGEQLQWYNTLLRHRHRLRVRTVVVLLRPEADSPRYTGVYRDEFPGEPAYLEFHYRVLRLWQVPVDVFLQGGLGTLPLAPLADVPEESLPGVLHRMGERLAREAPPEQEASLWTAAFVLTGLRLPPEALAALYQGVRLMHESSAYQLIMAEGAVKEAKETLLDLGQKRFGQPSPAVTGALENINDLARLHRMRNNLLDVNSWEELLAAV
ncbi:MAG TPA: hypothetical protein VFA26_14640, partial [Gemmataceae bacterium]|nr:hypothetical protein [Gemmataceae bacterium]